MKHAHVIGWGHYFPPKEISNDDISEIIDTNHEWIKTRTGISSRHIVETETTTQMAFEAAARAIAVADISPSEVDLVIVATSTPDFMFPSTASQVQALLGAEGAGAFDLSAACSGFVYGLDMATQAIRAGGIKTAVVIGAEKMSRVLDWDDRGTCILFGDGAGAVVVQGSNIPGGVLASMLKSDGSGGNVLSLPAVYENPVPFLNGSGPKKGENRNVIDMEGRQVFRFATKVVPDIIKKVLDQAGMTIDDVSLIVPHQANTRIIESAAKKLGISPDKFFVNVHHAGNTSAASIPIALCEAVNAGKLKPNDNVIFVGFGGGLTWAATLIRWDAGPEYNNNPGVARIRYGFYKYRMRFRQAQRRIVAQLSGSPTPDARMKDASKK
ncbi:MAG: beta-ketoacyl-ACP synthase III [Chloroflexota bacterium]